MLSLLTFGFIAVGLIVSRFLYSVFSSPLSRVPGPLLARFTRFWYLLQIQRRQFEKTNISLHRKYGSIVRIAPNEYSVDDPEAVKTIYGLGNHFGKGPWYSAWGHPDPNRYGLFNHRNEQRHAEHRRKVGAAFAMSALVSYENYVDNCSSILCQRLEEFGQRNMAIDMFHWMQCYAFDVVGEITLGRRFGFLDAGEDVGHIMESIDKRSYSSTLIGIYAEWYPTVAKIMAMRGPTPDDAIANFTQKQIAELKTGKTTNPNGPECQVSKWLRGHSENPERFTTWDVLTTAKSNIAAGSDTTAIALCSVLYHLLKNPRTLVRLRDEIEEMSRAGRVSNPVKWKESQDMPYLQAVIKEALRVHPSTGLPMGRVVPEGGATLAGRFFPAGTVVGVNSWVASFNTSVFGNDAHEFRPERWLISDEKKLAFMDRYWIPFGLGSRSCIGKNISLMEMSKLIPQVVRRFELQLERPNEEWQSKNVWFVKQKDFICKISIRT